MSPLYKQSNVPALLAPKQSPGSCPALRGRPESKNTALFPPLFPGMPRGWGGAW